LLGLNLSKVIKDFHAFERAKFEQAEQEYPSKVCLAKLRLVGKLGQDNQATLQ
jgi:hypothetical protein